MKGFVVSPLDSCTSSTSVANKDLLIAPSRATEDRIRVKLSVYGGDSTRGRKLPLGQVSNYCKRAMRADELSPREAGCGDKLHSQELKS
jgi:hypothetical protein